MRSDRRSGAFWFVAGLCLGAAAGVILAPRSGEETRRYLVDHAGSARELYDKGRELADEAARLYEDGRHLVEG